MWLIQMKLTTWQNALTDYSLTLFNFLNANKLAFFQLHLKRIKHLLKRKLFYVK